MAVKFNPFTGQLQIDEKGSGGGSSYLDGEVQNFSALPDSIGSPAVDSAYLVREAEGAWLLNRKPAGIYIRTANTGTRASDWTYAGEFPDVFNDANLVVYNNTDSTKNAKFNVSAIATGTTRTISVPNKNVTLDDAGDSRTPTAHAASHAAAGSDPLAPSDIGLGATDAATFASVEASDGTDSVIVGPANITSTYGSSINFDEANFRSPDGTPLFQFGNNDSFDLLVPLSVATAGDPATVAASTRANLGLGDAATADIGTGSTEVAAGDHAHGNLTNDGKVGSDSGRVLVTTTAGAVTTLALGTAGQVLTVNSGANGVEFAAASGGGVTGASSSASDVLGVSGSDITGVDAGSDKIVFWDDSASELTYLTVGSGLSLTDTTLTATASGGSKTYATFTAEHNQPPSTAFATLDTRNSIAVLDYDAATDESAVFVGIMPEAASLGSGLIVRLHWMATSATSGNVRWGVQFERSNTDLDADSFDTAVEATSAANGTSGILTTTAITVTTIDGITAGDVFRLKVFRNADDATNDTMTGDAELVAVEVRSAA